MSCKLQDRPDWKAYMLGEMDANARQEAESHAAACSDCQDELAQLRVTLDTISRCTSLTERHFCRGRHVSTRGGASQRSYRAVTVTPAPRKTART